MKKFWRIAKRVLLVISGLSGAALFIVILSSAIKKQNELVCHSLQVKIDYDSGLAFLSDNEIKSKINILNGGDITGKRIAEIDFRKLESDLKKNPYVKNAEVSVDQSQNIEVNVTQKRPILRIINNDGVSYYLSEKNEKIPWCDNFTPHVAVALGNVELHKGSERDSSVQAALYQFTQFIRKDEFLNALVDQVKVEEDGEMDIIPGIGEQVIHFGKADADMALKFERLKVFYNEGLRKVGWNKYKSIDLRYKDQVVCEKKEMGKNEAAEQLAEQVAH